MALSVGLNGPHLTITPDGSRVVYRGAAGQIFVRALDQLEPTALPGLGAPLGPVHRARRPMGGFFRWKLVTQEGADHGWAAVPVAPLDGGIGRGATWGRDGTIVFATARLMTGLQRVAAAGGEVTVLTTPDRARGEANHIWPEFLPDGQNLLFTITAASGGLDAAQIAVLDLRTGTADRAAARGQPRAVPAHRTPRLWGRRHAARRGVRPEPTGGGWDPGPGLVICGRERRRDCRGRSL